MVEVIHSIHFPVSARSFISPVVEYLNEAGIKTELWVENQLKHQAVIEQLDVPKQLIDSDLVLNPLAFLQRLSNFRRHLRTARPKILHTHQSRASLIPLLAAYLERVPVRIYQNHGLPYLGYRGTLRWSLRLLEAINLRLATHVLLVSHSNLQEARADGLLDANQGAVMAHGSIAGIDLLQFDTKSLDVAQAKQHLGVADAPFVLAYVGRPVRRKGFHLLLQAWERSGLGDANNVLLVAGCTADECDQALGHKVAGVKGLGYLTDLHQVYTACDVVTLPSEHEGFPYSLLEGAAAAKALIGTDIPGVRCAIQAGQTGLLVPAKDEVALAEAIEKLAFDPALRSRLGQNARQRVEQQFSRELVLKELLTFYQTQLDCFVQDDGLIRRFA
ncbi:MAG: glycosyltransferase family 4 protein [Myxacorys chilensis ATA2-1-KO14]|jgi:glycosyltransferase involved in cell wall biosynthesis|nr:glycosyltransferase family 4 protein [Myxacorys chilensis ATA2-1-KO14]